MTCLTDRCRNNHDLYPGQKPGFNQPVKILTCQKHFTNQLNLKKSIMKGGAIISTEAAKRMVEKYQHVARHLPAGEFKETSAIHFDRQFLEEVLRTKDAEGIKFYFAVNEDKRLTLVLIPTNEKGEDLQTIPGFPHSNQSSHISSQHSGPIIASVTTGTVANAPSGVANHGNPYP